MSVANIFSISGLLLGLIGLTLAVIIFKYKRSRLHLIWLMFNVTVSIWGWLSFIIGRTSSAYDALILWRISCVPVYFISVFFFHVVYEFCKISSPRLLFFVYLHGVFASIAGVFTNLYVSEVYLIFKSLYYDYVRSYVGKISFVIWGGLVIYGNYRLFKSYLKNTGIKKLQTLYLLVAMLVGFSGGITNFFPYIGLKVYPYGNFGIIIYCLIGTYAILRYRLMDISVAITRTTIFIAVYTLVLGIPFILAIWHKAWLIDIFGANWWAIPLGLMAALGTAGPFFYIYIASKAEEALLREQRRYQNTLKQASIGMTRVRSLQKLLDLIVHIVTKTVRISYAAIYLHDTSIDEYVVRVSRDHGKIALPKMSPNNPLITWINFNRQPLVYEEIKHLLQDTNDPNYKFLEENMRQLFASVIIPTFIENKFLGFIVLGDKTSGQMYTPEDLNVFQVLASQSALAIENAQFYEEAKVMHEQIAQAEKMATIGTMADGLSHQINNRFYALSLIAGDSIDTIKMTDTSKCTPEVQEMIKQINYALQKIQSNVLQGGEVVKGILKYTRKGDESMQNLTLDQVLDGTLDMVQYKVKLSDIDIIRDYFPEDAKIRGNLVQLEEVFFNFIDNAYDAIVERKDLLKEPGYRGKILITAKPKYEKLEIIIEDNGLGVKEECIKKIFTPFFTTKVSSRKGTGLGLYVVRKIIVDNHKGKIDFSSEYKVGTRFTIELPIA